ncbi:hypothetical protein VNO77_24736 [Canavalia gladiata]|uniref:Uncharacterized protein n=1 Tax=Canavalia gladiata TaxID=3824 RepID=A0AAN9L7J8_CANGL
MAKITVIRTLLVALTVSFLAFASRDWKVEGFYLAVALSVAAVMIVAFRATMVAWITILVLLAFAGNRRSVLVQRGRRITLDVAWCMVSVIFTSQRKRFLALACAALVSLLATYR